MNRLPPSTHLMGTGVVAVLRAPHATEYAPVVESLIRGGVRSIELTLSTPGVFEELEGLQQRFGADAELGIGTVTTLDQARTAIDAGAAYLVTPVSDGGIVEAAVRAGVAVYPGGLTPTELFTGWRLGASAVKVFPASAVGPGFIGQLRGPFPDIAVLPSGGVEIDDVARWIDAGAIGVSLGGPLLQDAFRGGDLAALTDRAARVVAIVAERRSRR